MHYVLHSSAGLKKGGEDSIPEKVVFEVEAQRRDCPQSLSRRPRTVEVNYHVYSTRVTGLTTRDFFDSRARDSCDENIDIARVDFGCSSKMNEMKSHASQLTLCLRL